MNAYPLTFEPIFKERIWGGRNLETLYNKSLPDGVPIGESWEITDRPEGVSTISNGKWKGKDLRWLMETHQDTIMGKAQCYHGKFPLLVKILDAQEKLSLQVHPPAHKASELNGEPKTEMWFLTHTEPGADLFVGLKPGVSSQQFLEKVRDGSVADCFQRIEVFPGDAMFLPSGRVHAIGAGNVIFEIQQNSDTTYRVFDWNRVGLDGQPRELHIDQSMASIDFQDFNPELISPSPVMIPLPGTKLVEDKLFDIYQSTFQENQSEVISFQNKPAVIGVYQGSLTISGGGESVNLTAGSFSLIPAALEELSITSNDPASFVCATAN